MAQERLAGFVPSRRRRRLRVRLSYRLRFVLRCGPVSRRDAHMIMNGFRTAVAAACICIIAAPASAALKVGDKAPDFTAPGSLGGKSFTFTMADALKKGPVVLYFYPSAYTNGCDLEAHTFAVEAEKFA